MQSILILSFMITFIESNVLMNTSDKALILFSDSHQYIRKAHLNDENTLINSNETEIVLEKELKLGWVVGLDYSISGNLLLWNNQDSNMASPLDKRFENALGINAEQVLNKLKFYHSAQIAFDWINDLLYFTDMYDINVISIMNTNLRYVVIENEIDVIVNIAIDPLESYIFWVQYEYDYKLNNSEIMRSYGDGSNKTVLINSSLKQLYGMALDLQDKNVYWIEPKPHTLFSSDYNGNNRRVILRSEDLFGYPNHMDFFQDFVYWSSYKSVFKTHKSGLNGTARITVIESDSPIDNFKIVHPLRQPFSANRCLNSNCSHLCLPNGIHSFRCLCPSIRFYKFRDNEKCYYTKNFNTEEIRENSFNTLESREQQLSNSSSSPTVVTSILVIALINLYSLLY